MRQWSTRGGDIQFGRSVSGGAALVQRHEHMLQTAPGELGSDPEWGIGARTLLGRSTVDVDISSIAAVFRAQHLRDPETADVQGSVQYNGTRLEYDATIVPTTGTEQELQVVIE